MKRRLNYNFSKVIRSIVNKKHNAILYFEMWHLVASGFISKKVNGSCYTRLPLSRTRKGKSNSNSSIIMVSFFLIHKSKLWTKKKTISVRKYFKVPQKKEKKSQNGEKSLQGHNLSVNLLYFFSVNSWE